MKTSLTRSRTVLARAAGLLGLILALSLFSAAAFAQGGSVSKPGLTIPCDALTSRISFRPNNSPRSYCA